MSRFVSSPRPLVDRFPDPSAGADAVPERLGHDRSGFQGDIERQNAELRAAQVELELSRNRYYELFDAAPMAWLVLDESGVLQQANQTAAQLYAEARVHLKGRHLALLVAEAHRPRIIQHLQEVLARNGQRAQCEVTSQRNDGTTFSAALDSVVMTRLHAGRPTILTTLTDVTAQKEAQRFLATALDSLAGQIAIVDEHTRILAVNRSWRNFAEENELQRPDPQTGRFEDTLYLCDRLPPDSRQQMAHGLREVMARRQDEVQFEYPLRTRTGERWFSMRITRFADEGPMRLVLANEDVTPRRQAEEATRQAEARLRQAQKMDALGRLAGGVAHDFNNVLTAIKINAENLIARPATEAAGHEDLEEIIRAADRATALTQQLLSFSRKDAPSRADVNLNDVVGEAERLLRRLIGTHIELSAELDPTLPPVRADAGQLQQIVMNLAINARDAMSGGGRLTLQTRTVHVHPGEALAQMLGCTGAFVQLCVADTGVGMDATTKARIFEPFFTTKEQGRGTGLGLATVFTIVQQSGGHVSVHSEPGLGTTFSVWLPAVAPSLQPARRVSETRVQTGSQETVLLVEDEPSIRRVARLVLAAHQYRVLEAGSGDEALALLADHPEVAAVVSDVMMPGMDGSQLCKHLEQSHPLLPIILISGFVSDPRVMDQVQRGCVTFLQKPFSPKALAARVRSVLDQAKAAQVL